MKGYLLEVLLLFANKWLESTNASVISENRTMVVSLICEREKIR